MQLLNSVVFFQKHSLNLTLWTLLALPAGYAQKKYDFSKNNERNNIDNPSDMDFLKLEPKPKLVVFGLGRFHCGGSRMGVGGVWEHMYRKDASSTFSSEIPSAAVVVSPAKHAPCHICPPAIHTPCHACPPAMHVPFAMHAPHHACPPAMHTPCHVHPLPHMPPPPHMPPTTHAPHHAYPPPLPPWTELLTQACKNLFATSFADGNKLIHVDTYRKSATP